MSSISDSTPALSAVTLREPPRRNSAAATVWLPSRRFTRTFRPLTSNSVTSLLRVSPACTRCQACAPPRPGAGRSSAWGRAEASSATATRSAGGSAGVISSLLRLPTAAPPSRSAFVNPEALQRLRRQQREADVRLALDVRGHVPADVRARRRPQPLQIAAEVIEAGRRPPESDRVRVGRQLLARVQVVGLEQRLRALELLVGEVVGSLKCGRSRRTPRAPPPAPCPASSA